MSPGRQEGAQAGGPQGAPQTLREVQGHPINTATVTRHPRLNTGSDGQGVRLVGVFNSGGGDTLGSHGLSSAHVGAGLHPAGYF